MELVILGSGTCVPSLSRGGPAQLIRAGSTDILIDSGVGTMGNLLRAGLTYHDISMILYTHTHPDHTAELVPFLFACKYSEKPRTRPLTIIGGEGFKEFFHKLEGVYSKWIQPELFNLKVVELVDSKLELEGLRIATKKTAHIRESVGFRVEHKGKSIVVSGDTGYCDGIVALGRNSDLLVIECSHPDGQGVPGHLTPSLVGRIASESRCKRLVLSHFYPEADRNSPDKKVRECFGGEVIVATDLLKVTV